MDQQNKESQKSGSEGSSTAALQSQQNKQVPILNDGNFPGLNGKMDLSSSQDVPVQLPDGRSKRELWYTRGRKASGGASRGRGRGKSPLTTPKQSSKMTSSMVDGTPKVTPSTPGRESVETSAKTNHQSDTMAKKKSGAQRRKERRQRTGTGQSEELQTGSGTTPQHTAGLKRTRSAGNTPPESRQAQKRANNRTGGATAVQRIVVAIVGRGYPEVSLDESRVIALEEAVMRRVMEQSGGHVPQFEARRLIDGAIHVTCRSELDRTWLQQNVSYLKPWDGADLVTKSLDQLAKRTKVRIYTKVGGSVHDILKALGTFNKELRVDSWRLLEHKKSAEQGETILLVSVNEKELRELQKLDMRPCLGLGRAKCHVLGGGGGAGGSKEGTGEEEEGPQGPEIPVSGNDNPGAEKETAMEVVITQDVP